MFDVEMRGDVAVVKMNHGKANALDIEFCEGIVKQLDALRTGAKAVVWTATGGIFCAGVDLKRVLAEGTGYLHTFLPALSRAFKTLYAFPNPMVSAINGHALAGGCIVAIAGDYRIMAEGGATIGVPELRVGVPFPSMALEMVRQCAGRNTERVLYFGERHTPQAGLSLGLVDELTRAERLLDRAVAVAEDWSSLPADAFAVTKWQVREQVFLRLEALEDEEREVERIWMEAAALDRIRAYVDAKL
ncbi:MAG: enoyl-CoA hydratase/isomerase family protein [Gammaproteobacteria bacterium]|nr:enoyl-CoA hydratase/isomerase family protein [Gammaproteobacteria bacterium]